MTCTVPPIIKKIKFKKKEMFLTKLLFRARRPGLVGGDTNAISRIMKQIKESKTNTEKEKEPVVQKTDAERRRSLLKSRGSRPLPSVVAPSADFKLQILEKGSVVNKENSIKNFLFLLFASVINHFCYKVPTLRFIS